MIARILTIAGSDSSGGAGIEADLKTISALGGYGCTAITGLTAQNTLGVQAIHPIPAAFVARCIKTVVSDIGVDAIKIGMLTSAATIHEVVAVLPPDITLVLDPVILSTSGAALLPDDAITSLITRLLPRASLITPNLPEATRLTGLAVTTFPQRLAAGHKLLAMGAKAALIKGGHGLEDDMVTDLLVTESGHTSIALPRLTSRNTHGTGCTLSAAIATFLAQGEALETACRKARFYLQNAIATAPGLGSGPGPVNHLTNAQPA